jgi:hypothetical protein
MKKRLAGLVLLGAMVGAAGGLIPASAAVGGTCAAPASVQCTTQDSSGNTISCTVFVSTDQTGDQCINPPA